MRCEAYAEQVSQYHICLLYFKKIIVTFAVGSEDELQRGGSKAAAANTAAANTAAANIENL